MKNGPVVKKTYKDALGRTFKIGEIDIGNYCGREIIGYLIGSDLSGNYSCTLKDWADIWRDKIPSQDPSTFKC